MPANAEKAAVSRLRNALDSCSAFALHKDGLRASRIARVLIREAEKWVRLSETAAEMEREEIRNSRGRKAVRR